eukprot:TRINITY_DN10593_c0_g1_i1.p1 TRINITY_DN10593_c0_g1~~TRINITY_DN10593_c0_g1_i1.p1  ORF type:complete len:264 (+),score=58.44 TRINITY_DN10593_c0_g1_i1:40-831(+)
MGTGTRYDRWDRIYLTGLKRSGKSTFIHQVKFIMNNLLSAMTIPLLKERVEEYLHHYIVSKSQDFSVDIKDVLENDRPLSSSFPINVHYALSIYPQLVDGTHVFSLEDVLYFYYPTDSPAGFPITVDYGDQFVLVEIYDLEENMSLVTSQQRGRTVFFCSVIDDLEASKQYFLQVVEALGTPLNQDEFIVIFTCYDILSSILERQGTFVVGDVEITELEDIIPVVEGLFTSEELKVSFSHLDLLDRTEVMFCLNNVLDVVGYK